MAQRQKGVAVSRPHFCAVIPAAGLGTRMEGVPKALCRLARQTLLERAVCLFAAGGVASCFVVTGHGHDEVAEHALSLGAHTVHNPAYRTGMFSSVRAGLVQAQAEGIFHGCFVLPVDIPLVSPAVISKLVGAWQSCANPESHIFIPEKQGATGHPPLLGHPHFAPAALWRGPEGLRGYMASLLPGREAGLLLAGKALPAGLPIRCVRVSDAAILRDIDTPEDLAGAEQQCRAARNTA